MQAGRLARHWLDGQGPLAFCGCGAHLDPESPLVCAGQCGGNAGAIRPSSTTSYRGFSTVLAPTLQPVSATNRLVFCGAPGKNRTCDLGFRKALLYPTELRGRRESGGKLARQMATRKQAFRAAVFVLVYRVRGAPGCDATAPPADSGSPLKVNSKPRGSAQRTCWRCARITQVREYEDESAGALARALSLHPRTERFGRCNLAEPIRASGDTKGSTGADDQAKSVIAEFLRSDRACGEAAR